MKRILYKSSSESVETLHYHLHLQNPKQAVPEKPTRADKEPSGHQVAQMKLRVMCGSVIILMIGIQSSLATNIPDHMAAQSDHLIRERRDEDPAYPDDFYDTGEQDRWPTPEELSNKRFPTKRGQLMSGLAGLEEAQRASMTRKSLENSLYNLLSTRPRPAPESRSTNTIKDGSLADLLKRHRLPRSLEETTLERSPDLPVSEQHDQNESAGGLSG
ncbi:uncharacterized protein PAF06_000367 [Gastrophryne carolinensis]